MNIERTVLDSLHEIVPNSSFSKHSTIGFVNFTIKQFKDFKKEIESKLNIDITDLNFHKWKTVKDAIIEIIDFKSNHILKRIPFGGNSNTLIAYVTKLSFEKYELLKNKNNIYGDYLGIDKKTVWDNKIVCQIK